MLYIFISLLVFSVSYALFLCASGNLSLLKPNIVSWIFYIEIVIYTFIGANIAVLNVQNYLLDKTSMNAKVMGYWSVVYVMIVMPFSMYLSQKYLLGGNIRKKSLDYFDQTIQDNERQLTYWILLSILAIFATFYTYICINKIPLLSILSSSLDTTGLAESRFSVTHEFPGNEYIRNIFSLLLAPFTSYIAYAYMLIRKKNLYRIWFTIMLIIAISAITYNNEKSPIIFYAITLFFIKAFVRGGATRKQYLLLGSIIVTLIVMTTVFFAGSHLSREVIIGIFARLGIVQYAGVPLTYEAFPSKVMFLGGASFPGWMVEPFGINSVTSARILMALYNPDGFQMGTAGVINTLFIAEAWANFGLTGVILSPIWVGFVIQVIYNKMLSLPKSPANIGLMGFFMTSFKITGGLVSFVWNPSLIFIVLIVFIGNLIGHNTCKKMLKNG